MRKSCSVVAAAGITVAMLVIGLGLEVHFAVARPILERSSLERSSLERPTFNPTAVDRTLKGNRLPGVTGERPAQQLRLPDGCEARFSRTIRTSVNEVARRCVT